MIGKGGETIKNLQNQSRTRIQIDHTTPGDTKVVTITSDNPDYLESARHLIEQVSNGKLGPTGLAHRRNALAAHEQGSLLMRRCHLSAGYCGSRAAAGKHRLEQQYSGVDKMPHEPPASGASHSSTFAVELAAICQGSNNRVGGGECTFWAIAQCAACHTISALVAFYSRNAGWAAAASPAVTKLTGSSGSLRWCATLTSAPLAAQGGLCTRLPAPSDPLAWRCPELGKSAPLQLPQRSHACKCSELARAPYLATKPCLLLICHPVPACRSSQTTIPRVR